jgi:hypothetical protein
MAYYLSKRNELILLEFLPLLKSTNETVKLNTNDPQRLEYILRNAGGTERYSWIKDKYIFRCKDTYVLCSIRNPIVSGSTQSNNLPLKQTEERHVGFFEIAQRLMMDHPVLVSFSNFTLLEEEYEKLSLYCEANSYRMEEKENSLTFTKL